jgi:hypothetical protein
MLHGGGWDFLSCCSTYIGISLEPHKHFSLDLVLKKDAPMLFSCFQPLNYELPSGTGTIDR